MADYLRTMTQLRQQLRNVGSEHAISDDEMARLLLMGVAVTHRELVEQFDLPTRQGNPPTLQQVTNSLRSRDERDKMVNGSPNSGVVMSMNSGGDGRGAGGGRGGRGSGGRGGGRKWLPTCYHCKKKGHLKRDCYHYKNKQAKVKAESKNTEVKPAESKEKKKSKVIEHMEFLHNGDNDSSDSEDDDLVGMVQSARISRNASAWVLDTGTTTHVCTSRDSFVSQKQSEARFKVWDGQLKLSNVEYSPNGSVNLISLGVMEDNGWEVSSSPKGVLPRKLFLEHSQTHERLEFIKRGKHYWLKPLEMIDELGAEMAMMTVNTDVNELMRWHEHLGHLHVAAINHMADNGTVAGIKNSCCVVQTTFSCLRCMSAKHRRMSYKTSAAEKRTSVNYEPLTSDTCDMDKYLHGLRVETLLRVSRYSFILTHPYTPEKNALVEKMNGVLMNKMRTAMYAADLPNWLWPEVLQYIVGIDNMSPTRAQKGMTPSEKLLGTVPSVAKIRVCGSVGFVFVEKRKDALSPKAGPALLLGFASSTTGYRLLHLRTGQIIEARDVKFREDITVSRKYISALLMGNEGDKIPFVPLPVEYVATERVRTEAEALVTGSMPMDHVAVQNADADGAPGSVGESLSSGSESDYDAAETLRAGPAARLTGGTLGTTSAGSTACNASATTLVTRLDGYQLMLETQFLETPETVEEALRSPQREEWQAALEAEYESLLKNETWKLVERPKPPDGTRVNVLTTKWVLRIKRDENGKILRYKAKLLLCLEARHIDVETAFLNNLLRGVVIYMEQPAYFDDGTGRVCLLLKGIYGLKQAARIWYQTLHAHLEAIGFRRCAFDVGLYVRYTDGRLVLVTVYVNDMMVIGNPCDIDTVIEELRQKFEMKDLGCVKHLLSMEIHYEPEVMLCLSQSAYIDRRLVGFGMSNASSVRSPQIHNEKMLPLEKDKSKVNDPALPYRQLVGKPQYLVSCTRPDIANAVRCLGRHAGSYTKENFSCAKRVLQYLAGTRTYGLVNRQSGAVQDGKLLLCAYSDADHANCPDTSRSISGHVLKLNNWSFGFKSKKQDTVTDGTCKSELVAASTDNDIQTRRNLLAFPI
ncbi:unnamed protein product [Phytophthora fragariaefolia]|uniref:Unnamed protein product n=1 Tax=Phytophthora fragariaefolia TaxID=1490495 RepID=A0A9W7CJN3_9STRA|nr:unnamed protein product [Phytophthora fragariaefolia]